MKKAVIYCTCCGTLESVLPPEELRAALLCRANAPFIACSRLCRKEEAEAAREAARKTGAEGLAVAACSLSARGREAAAHLGADLPLEWADVREGCAWIHAGEPRTALAKAADLLCMGLAALDQSALVAGQGSQAPLTENARGQSPLSVLPLHDLPVLVIGAGPAGLTCAATLGGMGVKTVLAERRAAVGGMLPQLGLLFPRLTPGADLLKELARDLEAGGAELRLETTVSNLQVLPEGYSATLRGKNGAEEELPVAAVVLAAGAMPVLPRGYFRYGQLPGVGSQMELEVSLGKVERGEENAGTLPRRAVFLQCVAARDPGNPYCSAICCPTALKNALRLRALLPGGSVTVVHRNIVTPGIQLEELYRKATEAGVFFRNHDPAIPPEPVDTDGKLQGLKFRDALDGRESVLPADMLLCSTPLKPAPGVKGLAEGLGLRLDDMGFPCGREPVLPLSPHLAGVYLAGSARWPATAEQSLQQGRAAAVKAAAYMRALARRNPGPAFASGPLALAWTLREQLPEGTPAPRPAYVREEACSRCGRCVAACPYRACSLPEEGAMRVSSTRCGQCGSCAAVCPTGAARLPGESIGMLRSRIKEALGGTAL